MPQEFMKALFFTGNSVELRDLPIPSPVQGEVLMAVKFAGICSTDFEIMKGYMKFTGIPGHEFVGQVAMDAGSEFAGKRVVGEINCPCGSCDMCASGRSNHCPERTVLGIDKRDGVFAQYTALPEKNLFVLDEGIKDEEAVFTEPLAACFRVTEQLKVDAGMKIYVLGDGRLGQLMLQAISTVGARPMMVGKHQEKMNVAESLGFRAVPAGEVEPGSADVVIECTGHASGLRDGLGMLKPDGTLVLKSTRTFAAPLNLAPVVINEIKIIGSRCGPFEKALSALKAGSIKTAPLISGVFSLDEYEEAFANASSPDCIKILFKIS